jgi:hypothetical protein
LVNYANKYGLPLPGRLPNFRNEKALLLPSDKTKAEIHQDYVQAAEQLQYRKNHIEKVKMQRDHYRKQCENAKTNFSSLDVENKIRGIY